jgi:hypothetical protein
MQDHEKAWFGLWTLMGYSPAAYAKLRSHAIDEAIQDTTLRRCGVAIDARKRITLARGSSAWRFKEEVGNS